MLNKKYLALPIMAATVALLAGCAGGSGSSGKGADADSGPQSLTIGVVQNDKVAAQAVIDAFTKEHPKVTINVVSSDTTSYQTTLRTQLSANNGPDVFYLWPGAGNPAGETLLAKAGYLKDLSGQPWVSKIPTGIKALAEYKGKTYARPMTVGGIGAIYNMDAMSSAGLQVPTTWSDLIQFCSDAKAKGKVAFALGGATPSNTQFIDYALIPTLVYKDDPNFNQEMADGKATFADSGWKKAMQKNLDMQKAGCFEDNLLGTTYDAASALAASGKALSIVQTQGAIGQLTQSNPSGTFELQPFPADNADDTYMASSIGSMYAINKAAKNPALAQEFFDFLSSDDQANAYATAVNSVPAIQNASSKVPPTIESIAKAQKAGKTFPYPDVAWPNAKVQQTHLSVMQELLGGKTTVSDALKQMDAAYKD